MNKVFFMDNPRYSAKKTGWLLDNPIDTIPDYRITFYQLIVLVSGYPL